MCKMLHFQNIIVWCDRVAYIMRISVCICPSSFTHQRVCEQSCQVRGDQLSLSFDRDQVSQRHSVTLSPPTFLCAHVCVCVSVVSLQRHLLTCPRQSAWMTHMKGSLEWTSGDETAAYVCGSHLLRLTIFFGELMANTHAQLHSFDIRKVKLCSFSDGAVSQYQGQRKRELRKEKKEETNEHLNKVLSFGEIRSRLLHQRSTLHKMAPGLCIYNTSSTFAKHTRNGSLLHVFKNMLCQWEVSDLWYVFRVEDGTQTDVKWKICVDLFPSLNLHTVHLEKHIMGRPIESPVKMLFDCADMSTWCKCVSAYSFKDFN